MKKESKGTNLDFPTAASLYSLGQLSIREAADIARSFRHQMYKDRMLEGLLASPDGGNASATSSEDFKGLSGPSLQSLAKASIIALAQGLTRETIDPLNDIFQVRLFIVAVSDLLSDSQYDRASIFVTFGIEQCQLWDYDKQFVSKDAKEMREAIRQAAVEYINNPLNQDTSDG